MDAAKTIKRVSKLDAHYRGHPNGAQWCSRCTMFQSPDGCDKVMGKIKERGWCRFFDRKPKDWYGE